MQTVIILIHLMIVIAMVGLVLLQKSEGGGLGMGGGAGFLSSRGTANVLTRTTAILAAAFFATSLVLSIIAGFDRKPKSILDSSGTPASAGGARKRRRARQASWCNAATGAGGAASARRAAGATIAVDSKGRNSGPSLFG